MAAAAFKTVAITLKRAVENFVTDGCPTMAAALAYYALFSLPPLVVIITSAAGSIFDEETVREEVILRAQEMLGTAAAEQMRSIVERAAAPAQGLGVAAAISIGALLFASTSAFTQLQHSLNRAWGVEDENGRGPIRTFLLKRGISFGLVLGLGVSLLASLGLSAALASMGDRFAITEAEESFLHTLAFFVSWLVFAVLIAGAFYFLPDTKVPLWDALLGGIATSLAFAVGKHLLGLYLGHAAIGSAYGSASSLALTLMWFFFGAATLLFGAELTQAWGSRHEESPRRLRDSPPRGSAASVFDWFSG